MMRCEVGSLVMHKRGMTATKGDDKMFVPYKQIKFVSRGAASDTLVYIVFWERPGDMFVTTETKEEANDVVEKISRHIKEYYDR